MKASRWASRIDRKLGLSPNQRRVRAWRRQLEASPTHTLWYEDRYGVVNQIVLGENLDAVIGQQSHYDDPGVIHYLRQALKPGMLVFDIGANRGDFALHCAKRVGPSGRVVAFEPVASTFARLTAAIHHSADARACVTCEKLAVHNACGTVTIHKFPEGASGWNGLGDARLNPNYAPDMALEDEDVEAVTLDAYCDQNGITRIDLLKIDVEGFEVEVIQGARQLIDRRAVGSIIFEISLAPLAGASRAAADVLNAFLATGMIIHQIKLDGSLTRVQPERFEFPDFANYVARPE